MGRRHELRVLVERAGWTALCVRGLSGLCSETAISPAGPHDPVQLPEPEFVLQMGNIMKEHAEKAASNVLSAAGM